MMTVMFNATEAIMDAVSELIAKYFFGEKEVFESKYPLTLKRREGRWGHGIRGRKVYAIFDSPYLIFKPEIPLHINMDSTISMIKRDGKSSPAKTQDVIYLSSREIASDGVFQQLKMMIDALEKMQQQGGRKSGGS